MRSMFSNRYDNKRNEFYERYEAARALHPSLPLYERPKEPEQLETLDRSSRRRFKSYQELSKQSTEKYNSNEWLTSDSLSIVVRRRIEERNFEKLMPKYDPTAANHEFSHNARFRQRGRRPNAATMAKIVSDFAQQVGGLPREVTEEIEETIEETNEDEEDNEGHEELGNFEMVSQVIENDSMEQVEEEVVELVKPNNTYSLVDIQKLQLPKVKVLPMLKREFVSEDKENMPAEKQYKFSLPPRLFICPEPSCQQEFNLRRCLSKHQRDAGHHSWSHKCDRCGQVFRTAGFKRMHAIGACDRNLHKSLKHAIIPD